MLIDVIGYSACLVGLALCWRGLQGIPCYQPVVVDSGCPGYDGVAESLKISKAAEVIR